MAYRDLGALLIEKIEGCYFNVVGLPLNRLNQMLSKQGVYLLGGRRLMDYKVGIKNMPVEMRPREKMQARGEESLSDDRTSGYYPGQWHQEC